MIPLQKPLEKTKKAVQEAGKTRVNIEVKS